jgi:hypothetical protein
MVEALLKELQRKMAIYKMDTMETRHLIDNIIREARREGAAIPTVEVDVIDQGKLHLIEYMVRGGCKRAYAVALVYGLVAAAREEGEEATIEGREIVFAIAKIDNGHWRFMVERAQGRGQEEADHDHLYVSDARCYPRAWRLMPRHMASTRRCRRMRRSQDQRAPEGDRPDLRPSLHAPHAL